MSAPHTLFGHRVIAILRHITPAEVEAVGDALVKGGIKALEVTLNTDGALEMIETLARQLDGQAAVGAGTVLSVQDVSAVKDAGGTFNISPNTDPQVIAATKAAGLASLPGCFTPSEAFAALKAGADALKLFPADIVPPKGVKALKAVLPPSVPLYVVGGIDAHNLADYVAVGAYGISAGSAVYKPGKAPADVERDASALVQAMNEAIGGTS